MSTSAIKGNDLINPFIRDVPPQWREVPAELLERIRPRGGFFLLDEWRKFDKILQAHWLLLENYHHFRCGRCNAVHPYFTIQCIERPFNRLTSISALLKNQADESSRDLILRGISLGTIVPITDKEARKLVFRIELKQGRVLEWKH